MLAGAPKGVRLTLANHVASALGCQRVLGSTERDRWLLVLSPHHVGGFAILLRSVVCNQPVISLAINTLKRSQSTTARHSFATSYAVADNFNWLCTRRLRFNNSVR